MKKTRPSYDGGRHPYWRLPYIIAFGILAIVVTSSLLLRDRIRDRWVSASQPKEIDREINKYVEATQKCSGSICIIPFHENKHCADAIDSHKRMIDFAGRSHPLTQQQIYQVSRADLVWRDAYIGSLELQVGHSVRNEFICSKRIRYYGGNLAKYPEVEK